MKPFSRPTSGITLERNILPEIDNHQNSAMKDQNVSRNNVVSKGLSAIDTEMQTPNKISRSLKSRNQSALNVQSARNIDRLNPSRLIGRNGSVSSLLTIGTSEVTAASPMKGDYTHNIASKRGSKLSPSSHSYMAHRVGDATFKRVGS